MSFVKIYDRKKLLTLTALRKGETKAGEKMEVLTGNDISFIAKSSARFVLLGIPEDIGVRANLGLQGASKMWEKAIQKICNVQHNEFFDASSVLVLGEIDLADLMEQSQNASIEKLRELTIEIDNRVAPVIEAIVKSGKEAIVIGGGHNNSFPLLKGASKGLGRPMNCINIDPHADLRDWNDGRHSGNGFSFALKEKYLENYIVLGMHENYNSQFILDQFKSNDKLKYYSFENWLKGEIIWEECFEEIFEATGGKAFGFEFDLDSIIGFPSSAATPSGFNENDARIMVNHVALNFKTKYFHLAEGSPDSIPGKADLSAKMIAYLVTDYVKARTAQ
jgi:formiminoglutamase